MAAISNERGMMTEIVAIVLLFIFAVIVFSSLFFWYVAKNMEKYNDSRKDFDNDNDHIDVDGPEVDTSGDDDDTPIYY